MNDIFALVDCNNFYVSCERVFDPSLEGKPVVVLSNNDGVIIARSNEVKKMGVKMATPVFKIDELIRKHKIQVFSSNFVLYGDLSHRVMETLSNFTPDMEIYSIDEAFLSLKGFEHLDLNKYCTEIRDTVKTNTGIPVSIGIAKTKTLSKLANEIAKKDPQYNGVFDMSNLNDNQLDEVLRSVKVEDLWGVGWRAAPVLRGHGIDNAYDLKNTDDRWIRKALSVTGLKMVHEIRGIQCISLEQERPPQKSIACTRSFGKSVQSLEVLKEAVASFASRATEKLRQEKSLASYIQVFVHTNRHKKREAQYANSINTPLPQPTCDTPTMIKVAHESLEKIYKKGYLYKKAGVILAGLMPQTHIQLNLFDSFEENKKKTKVMKTMDKINNKWGSGTMTLAACGTNKPVWGMKRLKKSKYHIANENKLKMAKEKDPIKPGPKAIKHFF